MILDGLPIAATSFSANHRTHQLDFNLVANLTRSSVAPAPTIAAWKSRSTPAAASSAIRGTTGPKIASATPLPGGTTSTGSANSNGYYWPLTFGFRF